MPVVGQPPVRAMGILVTAQGLSGGTEGANWVVSQALRVSLEVVAAVAEAAMNGQIDVS